MGRSCLTDPVDINFERTLGLPEVRVSADKWVRLAELLLTPFRLHHQFSNYAIDVDGDHATGIIYLVAKHWQSTDNGFSEFIQNGWYDNRFVRVDGRWKVSRILHTHQWNSGNGALIAHPPTEAQALLREVFSEANRVPSVDEVID